MTVVRVVVAVAIVVVWAAVVLKVVLSNSDSGTGLVAAITPVVMVAVGYLLGGEIRKATRRD